MSHRSRIVELATHIANSTAELTSISLRMSCDIHLSTQKAQARVRSLWRHIASPPCSRRCAFAFRSISRVSPNSKFGPPIRDLVFASIQYCLFPSAILPSNFSQHISRKCTRLAALVSEDERPDLFHGAAGPFGTLGITTLVEIQLRELKKYVETTCYPVSNMSEAMEKIEQATSDPSIDYVDGILFLKKQGAVITGRPTGRPQDGVGIQSFSDARNP